AAHTAEKRSMGQFVCLVIRSSSPRRPSDARGRCAAGFRSGLCPLWVSSGHYPSPRRCSLYPRKLTKTRHLGMSALCHGRQSARLGSLAAKSRADDLSERLKRLVFNQLICTACKPTCGAHRLASITGQGGEAALEPVSASAALI